MTIQVFLPHLSLALEYQGETHYFSSHIFGKASTRQRADEIKQNFAKQMGITLIPIPFWWDKSSKSLASTIQLYRPDIQFYNVSKMGLPIPAEMPAIAKNRFKYVPSVPKKFNGQVDIT